MPQEEIWVTGPDYRAASADPLREYAKKIVEDMNRNHWEDIRRFCLVYVQLDAEVCPRPWLTPFKLFSHIQSSICFCFSHSSGDLITYAAHFPTLYQTETDAICNHPYAILWKSPRILQSLGYRISFETHRWTREMSPPPVTIVFGPGIVKIVNIPISWLIWPVCLWVTVCRDFKWIFSIF